MVTNYCAYPPDLKQEKFIEENWEESGPFSIGSSKMKNAVHNQCQVGSWRCQGDSGCNDERSTVHTNRLAWSHYTRNNPDSQSDVHSVLLNGSSFGLVGSMMMVCILSVWCFHSFIGLFVLAIFGVIIIVFPVGMAHSVMLSHNPADLHSAIEHPDSDENVNFAGGTHISQ